MSTYFRRSLLLLMLACCFVGSALPLYAQQQKITLSSPVGGVVGGYVVHLPDDYDANPTKRYPTMIFLHGLSETGSGSQTDLDLITNNGPPNQIKNGTFPKSFTVGGEVFKYIVISPQFNRRLPVISPEEYQTFLDYIKPLYRIDTDRLYFTGISIGGGLIWNYTGASTDNASKVAAVVIMAGSSKPNQERANNIASQNLPVWAFHNSGDPSVPVENTHGYVDTINMYVPAPVPLAKKSIFQSNSHGVWYTGYSLNYREDGANVYEWMLRYKRSGSTPPNILPVARAGADQTITLPVSTVSVNGSSSTDADGTITGFLWEQVSGPKTATIGTPSQASTSISQLTVAGTYRFRLTVTDNRAGTNSDLIDIIVQPANNVNPTANAGADQTVQLPQSTVNLSGAASNDPDGSIVSYQWQQLNGPRTTVIQQPSNVTTQVTGLTFPGQYTYRLTVVDNQAASSSDQVVITILEDPNEQPVANAGPGVTIQLPTSSASLSGSSSYDPDGTIVSYSWSFMSGPRTPTIQTPNAVSTNVSGLTTAGIYTFELQVTDNDGSSNSTTTDIVVQAAANQPPVANAGADRTIQLPTSSSTLSGTASTDPDGTIVSYAWTQLNGPRTATITTPNSSSTSVSGLTTAGTYQFQLRVTDNDAASATDVVNIVVQAAANQPPVANAGADRTIQLPTSSSSLSGSASTDADGTIVSYAWSQLSGPRASTITTPNAVNTTISGLTTAGTYEFQLRVTDNDGSSATDVVNIVVQAAANQPPVANAGADKTIQLPTSSSSLSGSASTDADGTIVSYAWSQLSGPRASTITTPNAVNTTISGLTTAGTYEFQLRVTDNDGSSATDVVNIVVQAAANQPPVANAGADKTIQLPTSSSSLSGSASTDADGTIVSYAWSQLSGPRASTITTPNAVNTTISGLTTAGTYEFQLRVTDNDGSSATDVVNIVVQAAANQPPVANAGADRTIQLPNSAASLSGSASSDPDGTIATYAWSQLSGPRSVTINTPNAVNTNVSGLTLAGTYSFQLRVTDNDGASATDVVNVVVQPAGNQAPVAVTGPDRTVVRPASTVLIDGSTSYDNDGRITAYFWTKIGGPPARLFDTWRSSLRVEQMNDLGDYVFVLKVTDNENAVGYDTITVTVTNSGGSNQAPIANAGNNQSIQLPQSSTSLSGAASSDPDGSLVGFTWSQVNGPRTATIQTPNAVTTNISGLTTAGTYTFRLRVTDDMGAFNEATVQVTVQAAPINQPPVANAGSNQTIQLPSNSVFVSGTGSTDPDGTISTYTWAQTSGPVSTTILTPNSATTTINGLTIAGTYTYRLRVTDNQGATSEATVQIFVQPAPGGNQLPIAVAGPDIVLAPTQSTALIDGTRSYDPDGSIKAYFWTKVSGPSARLYDTWRSSLRVEQMFTPGEYVFELKVTDNQNAVGYDTVKIIVGGGAAPMAAPPAQWAPEQLASAPKVEWKVGPNPFRQYLQIQLTSTRADRGQLRLVHSNGQVITAKSVELLPGSQTIRMETGATLSGNYVLQLVLQSGKVMTTQVIKAN